jgi:hypothetical protein
MESTTPLHLGSKKYLLARIYCSVSSKLVQTQQALCEITKLCIGVIR